MKLRIIYRVNTPHGIAYLAADDDNNYYVKGVRNSIPDKFISMDEAMASYIGILYAIIDEYVKGCDTSYAYREEVTL